MDLVTGRDITFHGEGAGLRMDIDGKDGVEGVDLLEFSDEFFEERFDGVGRIVVGMAVDFNTKESVEDCRGDECW